MGLITAKQKYHCYNDCTQAGCPEHEMVVEYYSVTDSITVHFQGKDYFFDPTTLSLFLNLLKSMDRAEIKRIFREEPMTTTQPKKCQVPKCPYRHDKPPQPEVLPEDKIVQIMHHQELDGGEMVYALYGLSESGNLYYLNFQNQWKFVAPSPESNQ